MNLIPAEDRVLLRQHDPETETAFGLALPDVAQEKPMRATVLAVGAGTRDRNGKLWPIPLAVGDVVVIPRYGGTEIDLPGEETVISITAPEILAKLAEA